LNEELIQQLAGLSYSDWKILVHAVDRVFEEKKAECEQQLELSQEDLEIVKTILKYFTDQQSG